MKLLMTMVMAMMALSLTAKDDSQLQLNNGEKWIANQATHDGMTVIGELMAKADADETGALVTGLEKEIQAIIRGCTMKGAAHDELHKVLHPIIETVASLKAAANPADRQKSIDTLLALNTAYFAHFQVSGETTD